MPTFISLSAKQLLLLPTNAEHWFKACLSPAPRCSAPLHTPSPVLSEGNAAARAMALRSFTSLKLGFPGHGLLNYLPGLFVTSMFVCFGGLHLAWLKSIFLAVEKEIQSTVKKLLDLVMIPLLCLPHQNGLETSFQKAYARSWMSMSTPKSVQKNLSWGCFLKLDLTH